MNLPILMYHKIQSAPVGDNLSVPAAVFQQQVAYLKAQGYQTVALTELSKAVRTRASLPKYPVVITFADAYQCVYTAARPILEEFGFTATVFVVSGAVGGHNFWDDGKRIPRESCMLKNELIALSKQGWEIGSHGAMHANLTKVSDEVLAAETKGSRAVLERELDLSIRVFAYPFGAEDRRVRTAVQSAGYQAACAISPGTRSVTANILALRRIYIKPTDSLSDFKRKISKWYLLYRAWRKR